MKEFMCEDFLLSTETAKKLYHDHAKKMPIIDYHCHLNPKDIYENKPFTNMTELWLSGDHYKWRMMRSEGISEENITGSGNDYDKYMGFVKAVEYGIGNPMYHWTHLELKRYFDVHDVLDSDSAKTIWDQCNEKLAAGNMTPRALIEASNVKALCTTDDPIDDLKYHKLIKEEDFDVKVLPTFRPDKSIDIDKESFLPWIQKLEEVVGETLDSADKLLNALESRVMHFHEVGCRLADHGMDNVLYSNPLNEAGEIDMALLNEIYTKYLKGGTLTAKETATYKGAVMVFFGRLYTKLDWTMQMHIGALRNVGKNITKKLGPDSGVDSIGDELFATALAALLGTLDETEELPRTILYVLNPRDNYVIGTLIGCFQDGKMPGKIQFGSGWWFNDQKDGMFDQMRALGNLGLLSRFVGMLTDSRSFLSYTRHEYFRRILCELLGEWVENGEYPKNMKALGHIVENICYNNANHYFKL